VAPMRPLLAPFFSRVVISMPSLWLLALSPVPCFIVCKFSLSSTAIATPPYLPVIDFGAGWAVVRESIAEFSLDNYLWVFGDPLYINAYLSSLRIAAISTVLALLIGYPLAYGMTRAPESIRSILVMMVILPFWTSFLIRIYAWIGILKPEGLLN